MTFDLSGRIETPLNKPRAVGPYLLAKYQLRRSKHDKPGLIDL